MNKSFHSDVRFRNEKYEMVVRFLEIYYVRNH